MTDATRLLAMLEPAVRPGNLPGPTARLLARVESGEDGLPLEQRSFESLLEEARSIKQDAGGRVAPDSGHEETSAKKGSPLAWLGCADRIENVSVRGIHSRGPTHTASQG